MANIKVAYLAPEFLPAWGGVGIYSAELVKELIKYPDLEMHVITPVRGKGYDKKKIIDYFDGKIKLHNLSHARDTFFYNLQFQLSLLFRFQALSRKVGFDIIHSANLVHMPDILLRTFKRIELPGLCTVHTTIDSQSRIAGKIKDKNSVSKGAWSELFSNLLYNYIKMMESAYLKKDISLIAVSEFVKNKLHSKREAKVIHNGIDTRRFRPGKNHAFKFLDKIKMPKVLFTGRLLYMKGLSYYAKAIKKILRKQEVHFIFAGNGDVKRWEKELGIPKRYFSFVGYVPYPKIHQLYQKADVFALPSLSESCPLSVIEAMSCGVPVIATDVGGTGEIISHGKDGLLIPPADAKALSNAISSLLKDPDERTRIGRAARNKVLKEFDSRKMAKKTYEEYKRLVS